MSDKIVAVRARLLDSQLAPVQPRSMENKLVRDITHPPRNVSAEITGYQTSLPGWKLLSTS